MAYETVKSWKEEKLKSIISDNIFLFFFVKLLGI